MYFMAYPIPRKKNETHFRMHFLYLPPHPPTLYKKFKILAFHPVFLKREKFPLKKDLLKH